MGKNWWAMKWGSYWSKKNFSGKIYSLFQEHSSVWEKRDKGKTPRKATKWSLPQSNIWKSNYDEAIRQKDSILAIRCETLAMSITSRGVYVLGCEKIGILYSYGRWGRQRQQNEILKRVVKESDSKVSRCHGWLLSLTGRYYHSMKTLQLWPRFKFCRFQCCFWEENSTAHELGQCARNINSSNILFFHFVPQKMAMALCFDCNLLLFVQYSFPSRRKSNRYK